MFKWLEFLTDSVLSKAACIHVNAVSHMQLYLLKTLVKSHPIYPRLSASPSHTSISSAQSGVAAAFFPLFGAPVMPQRVYWRPTQKPRLAHVGWAP